MPAQCLFHIEEGQNKRPQIDRTLGNVHIGQENFCPRLYSYNVFLPIGDLDQ